MPKIAFVNESERLAHLQKLNLLGTGQDSELDSLTKLAAVTFQSPVVALTLVDNENIWFKSQYGNEGSTIERKNTFSDIIVETGSPLLLNDTWENNTFSHYEHVKGNRKIRAYIGVPLIDEQTFIIGTLCAIDTKPRQFTEKDIEVLALLAEQAMNIINLKYKINKQALTFVADNQILQSIISSSKGINIFVLDANYCYKSFTNAHIKSIQHFWNITPKIGDCILNFTNNIEDRQRAKDIFQRALNGEITISEDGYYTITNEKIFFESRFSPVYDDNNVPIGITVFIYDITERKKAESLLNHKQNILNEAEKITSTGSFEANIKTGEVVFSDGVYSICGYQPGEIELTIEKTWSLIHPEDLQNAVAAFNNTINNNAPYIVEKRFLLPDGSIKNVRSSGKLICDENRKPEKLIGVFQDITKTKQAEEALKLSEERWKFAIEGSNDGIWDWDMTSNEIFLSDTGKAIIGFEPGEYRCRIEDLQSKIHPEDRDKLNNAMIEHIQGNSQYFKMEYRVMCKNGSYKWVMTRGKIVQRSANNTPLRFVGSHTDIDEHKRAEQQLVNAQESLLKIFNFSPVPMVLSKVNGGDIMMVNNSLMQLSGYTKEELLANDTMFFYKNKEERNKVLAMFAQTGAIKNLEVQLVDKSGHTRDCLVSSDVVTMNNELMVITGFIEITDIKKISKALENSENNLKTIFNNTHTGYILFDTELQIVSFNDKMKQMVLEDSGMVLTFGKPGIEYFADNVKPVVLERFKRVLQGSTETSEVSIPQEDGSKRWFLANYFPVININKQVDGLVMSLEEITPRKNAEIELKHSLELVTKQNERLLNFSYIVSHNLRSHTSNMKSIINFLNIADNQEERNEMIGHLQTVSNSLDETLYHLNEVVAIQNNVNVVTIPLNLKEYIQKIIQLLGTQIAIKQAAITVNVDDSIQVMHNPAYLESILLNFVSNALKYSSPLRKPEIMLRSYVQNQRVCLAICDNGLGIDLTKNGNKIFGMYKTFHGNKDARGIGLFITKNQVEVMGGQILVESQLNVGTTFTIIFK